MMLNLTGLPVDLADQYRAGLPDCYGLAPEQHVSDGAAPCRCCLQMIPQGAAMLALAYRPFTALQPYAETGPIFLCADHCAASATDALDILTAATFLLKGYNVDERIIYGTGKITSLGQGEHYAGTLLARKDVAFVDLRSATNNCWLARITK